MNNRTKNILIAVCCLSFIFLFTSSSVFAQTPPSTKTQLETPTGPGTGEDNPLVRCGGSNADGSPQKPCDIQDLNNLTQDILNLVFMLAGFIVAGMFMYAGFLLITSVGDTGKIQKAKEIFRRVVVGFLIMLLAYLVVKNLVEKLNIDESVKPLFMNLFK